MTTEYETAAQLFEDGASDDVIGQTLRITPKRATQLRTILANIGETERTKLAETIRIYCFQLLDTLKSQVSELLKTSVDDPSLLATQLKMSEEEILRLIALHEPRELKKNEKDELTELISAAAATLAQSE